MVATPGPKRAERCPVGLFFEHLWDFSDSFLSEFSEVQHSRVPLPGALGTGRGVFSPKCGHLFVERTSMIAHIYPSVLQAVWGRGYAGCLETDVFRGAGVRLCRIFDMNFREFPFRNCLENRNGLRIRATKATKMGRRSPDWPLLGAKVARSRRLHLFSKQFLHALR